MHLIILLVFAFLFIYGRKSATVTLNISSNLDACVKQLSSQSSIQGLQYDIVKGYVRFSPVANGAIQLAQCTPYSFSFYKQTDAPSNIFTKFQYSSSSACFDGWGTYEDIQPLQRLFFFVLLHHLPLLSVENQCYQQFWIGIVGSSFYVNCVQGNALFKPLLFILHKE